jgi:SAM-dependent methyltransferase
LIKSGEAYRVLDKNNYLKKASMTILSGIKKNLKIVYSRYIATLIFPGSKNYWENRYASGNNSGTGSYGKLAEFKAEIINNFVIEKSINSVIEFGCGDGNQLTLAKYPRYVGYDVSPSAIDLCKKLFSNDVSKQFFLLDNYRGETFDLSMSLDVIYHLVEDSIYEDYMEKLFTSSSRFVIVYSSNDEAYPERASHIQPRKFTNWISQNKPDWDQYRFIPNRYPYNPQDCSGSPADFYIFKKKNID